MHQTPYSNAIYYANKAVEELEQACREAEDEKNKQEANDASDFWLQEILEISKIAAENLQNFRTHLRAAIGCAKALEAERHEIDESTSRYWVFDEHGDIVQVSQEVFSKLNPGIQDDMEDTEDVDEVD